ncbi:MAG: hypothetical protein AMS24_02610 [Chlamydiae bacterium SM23_39]|nr:MAG: hypothetical protein AMS24_02610 [Chlamydiae bacterium SM23_39]
MKNQSKTKFVILGLLTIKPLSGYGIKSIISKSIDHFWSESNGQIYPTLKLLLKEKLISLKKREAIGKKYRNIYSITKEGFEELKKWLNKPYEKNTHRDESLLKLFFGSTLSIEEAIDHIKKRKKRTDEKLKNYHLIKKELEKRKNLPHHIYWLITLNNGFAIANAEINWCKESIKILEGHKK